MSSQVIFVCNSRAWHVPIPFGRSQGFRFHLHPLDVNYYYYYYYYYYYS